MPSSSGPSVIQVTNISSAATKDQLNAFFGFIGNISAIQLYPESEDSRFASKVAYVKFADPESVDIALHLQNTVFNDRAIFIQPFGSGDGKFPTEKEALAVAAPQGAVFGILPKTKHWPARVVNQVVGQAPNQSIVTIDPKLQELGLPPYPSLTYEATDTSRIEDIRSTIYVSNLDASITCEKLVSFFGQAGEVRCARMTVFGADGLRGCFVEFCDQESVSGALTYNGCMFGDRTIRISHAMTAIERPPDLVQPTPRTEYYNENESDSVEEGLRRMRDAQAQISRAVEEELTSPKQPGPSKPQGPQTVSTLAHPPIAPVKRSSPRPSPSPPSKHRKTRSRSRSRSRVEKRDRDRRRHRSKSRSRSRSRGRRSGRKRDSRSASRERESRSRKDRKRSKSRDRDRRDEKESKSRKKDKEREKRDDKDDRRKKDKDDRDRKDKKKRSRSRSRDRSDKKSSKRRSRDRSASADRKASQPSTSVKINYDEQEERDATEVTENYTKSGSSKEKNGNAAISQREEVPMDTSSEDGSSKE